MTYLISNASLQPPVYDVYTALLIRVIPNQHFKSTLLGGGHKKEYAVYARENDDNYGRPLTRLFKDIFTFSNTFNGIPAGCIDCAIAQTRVSQKKTSPHNFAFSIFRFADLLVN